MATIRKRGNLQWEARIRRKGWPVTCKTFNTKLDAEKWARDVENDMDRGVFISRTEAERTTLSEALDRYITEYIPHLAHPHKEELKAKALQRRPLASKFMAGIRSKDIADFIRERQAEGVSGNTIRLDLALLSRLFNVAAVIIPFLAAFKSRAYAACFSFIAGVIPPMPVFGRSLLYSQSH